MLQFWIVGLGYCSLTSCGDNFFVASVITNIVIVYDPYIHAGEQFDKFGNNIPWWTNTSSASFRNKSDCILKTYMSYHLGNLYVSVVETSR